MKKFQFTSEQEHEAGVDEARPQRPLPLATGWRPRRSFSRIRSLFSRCCVITGAFRLDMRRSGDRRGSLDGNVSMAVKKSAVAVMIVIITIGADDDIGNVWKMGAE